MSTSSLPPLDRNTANIFEFAAAGVFLSLLMQPKLNWRLGLTIFSAGIIAAYFLASPLSHLFAHWTGADPIACLPVSGFTIGFVGMYIMSATMTLMQGFAANPIALVLRVRNIWSGKNGDDANN
jgi:hypothetical protein